MEKIISHVYKSGRAFNGSHRDAGTIIHGIIGVEPQGDWFGKSVCGTAPGYRGNGWSPTIAEINCPKCLRKIIAEDSSSCPQTERRNEV